MPLHSTPLQSPVKELAKMLIGTFDNSQQAAEDQDFILVQYDNCAVTLQDSPFTADAIAIFAEQTANTPTKSFARRRLMVVHAATVDSSNTEEAAVEVEFYTFKHDDRWAGFAQQHRADQIATSLPVIDAADLDLYECSLFFELQGDRFVGGTVAGGCVHHYAGAERLIIEAQLTARELSVWERWYDGVGQQVAGAVKGPYIYRA